MALTGNLLDSVVGGGRQALGEILLGLKKLDQRQLTAALAEQKQINSQLGDILIKKGIINQEELNFALALQKSNDPQAPVIARKKLGDLLLETGRITPAQLNSALELQNLSKKKIGEVMLELGFVSAQELESSLKLQDKLAFSSRNQILNNLESRNTGAVKSNQARIPKELTEPFPNRLKFLDAASQKAFIEAFGRAPALSEVRDFRTKLAFVFNGEGKLTDAMPANWQLAKKQAAFNQISSYYQNVIADRISTVVGGDAVQKRFDRLGNVDVIGLSPQDLEIAVEAVTMPDYTPASATEMFVANSPRAFFRSLFGREFASEIEEGFIDRLLKGKEGRALLQKVAQLLDEAFKAFPLARSDVKIRTSLVPTEDEMRELLDLLRNQHQDYAFEQLQHTKWFQDKLRAAEAAEQNHRGELSAIQTRQKLNKLLKLIENFLGKVPPELQSMITQLLQMVQSGGNVDLGNLEDLLTNLFEKLMAAFNQMKDVGASPEDMAEAMMAMLKAVVSGKSPDVALEKVVEKKKKSAKNAGALQNALGTVNQLNFFFKGKVGEGVPANDPMVQALMDGKISPEALEKGLAERFKGLPLMDALDFIRFLNKTVRGVDLEADPFDPWVKKLTKGEMPPGKIAQEWKGIYQPELVK